MLLAESITQDVFTALLIELNCSPKIDFWLIACDIFGIIAPLGGGVFYFSSNYHSYVTCFWESKFRRCRRCPQLLIDWSKTRLIFNQEIYHFRAMDMTAGRFTCKDCSDCSLFHRNCTLFVF